MENSDHKSQVNSALYPFENKFIQLTSGRMHYIDEGEGEILLFVHGTPTWSFLYRSFISQLSDNFRCIAIDHIGFGLSEKNPEFSGLPSDHSKNLVEFIEKMNLDSITLVVHDFGGPIGLSAGIHFPERIKKVVLFNSWLWEIRSNADALKIDKLVKGWVGKLLYLNFNFSPKVLLKKGFTDKSKLSKEIHNHYLNPFKVKQSRIPLLTLARALVGSSDWYQEQWERLNRLENKKWLILWGEKDEFITTQYLHKWQQRLPEAEVKTFDCGHFVQEEKPDQAITEILNFMLKS